MRWCGNCVGCVRLYIYRRHTLCTGGLGERPRAMDGVLHGIRLLLLYQNGFHVTLEGREWSSFLKKKYEK